MSESEVIPEIPIPKSRKAKVSVWKDIGVAETDHVLRISTVDETKAFLLDTFGIQKDSNGRYPIVLDMFYYAVKFCKENSFDSEKTSCLLSILKQTHQMATETPFGNIRETLNFCKDLILCHSVHRPPFSLGIFSPQEASSISSYFIDSYFRHFKLYKYIFTPQVQLDLTLNYTKFPNTTNKSFGDIRDVPFTSSRSNETEPNETMSVHEDKMELLQVEQQAPESSRIKPFEEADSFDPRTESITELKRLIRERLGAEIQELQASVNAQLQESDEAITRVATDAADPSKKLAAKKKK